MKKIILLLGILFLFNNLYSQKKYSYQNRDYTVTTLVSTMDDSLNIKFEFENKRQESLLISKETPCLSLRRSVTGMLLDLSFGIDLKTMTELKFLTDEINAGERKVTTICIPLQGRSEFTLCLTNSLYWVKGNKKRKLYNTDYKIKDYDWSEMYLQIKV